jgi:hypothetical protein
MACLWNIIVIQSIHQAAIKSLHSMYVTKRKLEKPKEEKWHRRKSTKVS